MQKIPLFLAKPGMRVAAEVKDEQGRVICAPGLELDASILERFQRLGVHYLVVEGHPVNFPWERPLEEDLEELEKRFSHTSDPRLLMLKELIKQYWQKSRKPE